MVRPSARQVNQPCWMLWVRSTMNHAGVISVQSSSGSARTSCCLSRMLATNSAASSTATRTSGQNRCFSASVSYTKRIILPHVNSIPCQLSAAVRTPTWCSASAMTFCPVTSPANTHLDAQHSRYPTPHERLPPTTMPHWGTPARSRCWGCSSQQTSGRPSVRIGVTSRSQKAVTTPKTSKARQTLSLRRGLASTQTQPA